MIHTFLSDGDECRGAACRKTEREEDTESVSVCVVGVSTYLSAARVFVSEIWLENGVVLAVKSEAVVCGALW